MLYTIAVILIIAWLLGFLNVYTVPGDLHYLIHVLLVVALVVIIFQFLTGRRRL